MTFFCIYPTGRVAERGERDEVVAGNDDHVVVQVRTDVVVVQVLDDDQVGEMRSVIGIEKEDREVVVTTGRYFLPWHGFPNSFYVYAYTRDVIQLSISGYFV